MSECRRCPYLEIDYARAKKRIAELEAELAEATKVGKAYCKQANEQEEIAEYNAELNKRLMSLIRECRLYVGDQDASAEGVLLLKKLQDADPFVPSKQALAQEVRGGDVVCEKCKGMVYCDCQYGNDLADCATKDGCAPDNGVKE